MSPPSDEMWRHVTDFDLAGGGLILGLRPLRHLDSYLLPGVVLFPGLYRLLLQPELDQVVAAVSSERE